ncbi:hypothetical protein LshimejAT787_0309920 [Lyophyllum shimeji]|uniref:Uncharacterized protein n=1 Tax=Lyophyllum shimeji TaxID=47721 RepID=A0A9P3PIC1_LYOSH|nr:hypothetical protein LshimejAT787_0309920 [Lyophyllum shimeji]
MKLESPSFKGIGFHPFSTVAPLDGEPYVTSDVAIQDCRSLIRDGPSSPHSAQQVLDISWIGHASHDPHDLQARSIVHPSVALPVDFSSDLSTRDFGEVDSSDLYSRDFGDWESDPYTRDLSDWESLDLFTRDAAELEDLVVREPYELDARAPAPTKHIGGSAAPAKKKLTRPKLAKPTVCRKRNGPCLNLFVVWYKPLAAGTARHWALFLSAAADAAAVNGATGTIYQVVDHREFPHLKPEKRENIQASGAGRYEGAKLLVGISKASMDEYYEAFKDFLIENIGEHNQDKKNIMCQSNCQHWVKELAGEVGGTDFSGVPT